MKNIRHAIAFWIQAALFIGLWLLFLYLSGETPGVSRSALNRIPDVVFIYGLLYVDRCFRLFQWVGIAIERL